MATAEEFAVDLGKLLQLIPKGLVGRNSVAGLSLLGGGLEEELPHLSGLEAGAEVEEGPVAFPLGATAVGLAATHEALDEGSPEEVAWDA